MAFDGITTMAVVEELNNTILLGKIDKIYQPEKDELVLVVYSQKGNYKLLISANPNAPRIHFIQELPGNPANPPTFCMLMRKHLQGGRIARIEQYQSERIVEITLEALNELGFVASKKLVIEIMGKHSNISLVDIESGKVVDCIKRISMDQSRARQLFPGQKYAYPPKQDKIPFKEVTPETFHSIDSEDVSPKAYLNAIGGISLSMAQELCNSSNPFETIRDTMSQIQTDQIRPVVYLDEENTPKEFSVIPLKDYESIYQSKIFDAISPCLDYFYNNRESSNRIRQKSTDLAKDVGTLLNKMNTKRQRLLEDLEDAKNSENLRLYGELLTANLHAFKTGDREVTLTNYYDNSHVTIPLDERHSPSKNAQTYFKKYSKAKTAVKEKQIQLEETGANIQYLESIMAFLENSQTLDNLDAIREELIETGYLRRKKIKTKVKKPKAKPLEYTTSTGMTVLVGRNNKENDSLTLKQAAKTDIWFHTKDIPGSHVILKMDGKKLQDLDEKTVHQVAQIAAYHSKGMHSANVPVDYVPVRYVKKPAGAKPGMVIFTNNKTVWVDPKIPEKK